MWLILIPIGIFLLCITIGWRICWMVLKPIFTFVYQFFIDILMQTGMKEDAAKATISLVIVIIVVLVIFF